MLVLKLKNNYRYIVGVFILNSFRIMAEGEPKIDTLRLKVNMQSAVITKARLVNIVDSLLDLNEVDEKQIEAITYYNSMLESKNPNTIMLKYGAIPATNYYDDFDENTVFQITPEEELADSTVLVIENDSLGRFSSPKLGTVTSKFGWRDGRMHKGIDIQLSRGEAISSAFDGMVRYAQKKGSFGNVIIIRHYNGLETVYAHLSKIKVKIGQVVKSGSIVGLGGNTGRSSGPHLHFEIRFKGQALNPASIISFTDNQPFNNTIVIKKTRYGISTYPSNAKLHTIEKGETWFEIAKQYGLTLKELCYLNATDRRYYLKVGQTLRIN